MIYFHQKSHGFLNCVHIFQSQSERLVHVFTVELKTILSNKKKCSSIFGVVHNNTNGVPKRQISFFKKQYQKHIYELDKTLQCR